MNKNTEKLMPLLDALWMLRWGVKFGDNDDPDFIDKLDDVLEKIKEIVYKDGKLDIIADDIDDWVDYFEDKINCLPEEEIYTIADSNYNSESANEFNLNSNMSKNARKAMYEEIFSYIHDVMKLYILKSAGLEVAVKNKEITDVHLAKEEQKLIDFKNMLSVAYMSLIERLEFITNINNINNPHDKRLFQEKYHDERLYLNKKLDQLEELAFENKIISFSEYVSLPTREIAVDSNKQLHNQLKVDREKLDFIKDFIDVNLRDIVHSLDPNNRNRKRARSKH